MVFSHPEVAEYAGRVYVDESGRTEVELRLAPQRLLPLEVRLDRPPPP